MWTQCTSVTDGQTDGRTDGRTDRITITKTVQRIASHGKRRIMFIFTFTIVCYFFLINSFINVYYSFLTFITSVVSGIQAEVKCTPPTPTRLLLSS